MGRGWRGSFGAGDPPQLQSSSESAPDSPSGSSKLSGLLGGSTLIVTHSGVDVAVGWTNLARDPGGGGGGGGGGGDGGLK